MKKDELVTKIAEKTDLSKSDVNKVLVSLATIVTDALKANDEVTLQELGKFLIKERAAKTGRNPHTGETIEIAATKAPSFKAAKPLKDALKGLNIE
ncbi:HU family DNA-binding protein [Eggerthia catenaformis]